MDLQASIDNRPTHTLRLHYSVSNSHIVQLLCITLGLKLLAFRYRKNCIEIGTFVKRYYLAILFFLLGMVQLRAQCPGSAISSMKTEYCINDFVELQANGVPSSAIIEWNIGNGWDTASAKYVFPAEVPGNVTIALRLTLGNGTICNYNEKDLVRVHDLPKADFEVSRNLICTLPDTIRITDKSPTSFKRNWVLNKTTIENTPKSIIQRINQTGNYNITLVVQDTNGCRNATTQNTVFKAYNDIDLFFTNTGNNHCTPVKTDFKSTFSMGTQTVKSYQWLLPGSDKSGSTTKDVSGVTYKTPGVYNAGLKLTTNQGCVYEKNRNSFIRVGDTAPLDVSVSASTACLSEKVLFKENKHPSPGKLKWNIAAASITFPDKYQAEMTFKDTGSFDLNLVYDYNGCVSTLNKKNVIRIQGLKADFISDNAWHCEAPHTVDLINTSDTSSGKISGFYWRVIDSASGSVLTTSTKKDFSFKINSSPAVYHVELITSSSAGCNDTTIKRSFARVLPYRFDFYADPDVVCVGQDIDFINKTPSGSYYGLDLFSWDFLSKDKAKVLGSSGSLSPSFSYSDTGYYPVQLTAANPLGCQEKYVKEKAVQVVLPILDYNKEDSVMCFGDSLRLISRSYPNDSRFINNYTFKHVKTGQVYKFSGDTVSAWLPEVGEYKVAYNYSIDGGCHDSILNTVWVNGLKGTIDLDTQSGCAPLVIRPKFNVDYNVYAGFKNGDLSYYWDVVPRVGAVIQGATTSQPLVTLNQDREYRITLYVSNSSGCVNYVISDPIVTGVNAKLTLSRKLGCVGDTIVLKDWSSNDPTDLKWFVDRTSGYQIDSVDPKTSHFILKDTGTFVVSLVASKNNICSDTVRGTINVTRLKAAFSVLDTTLKCAPGTVRFINQSVNADSLFWFFDDGNTLRQEVSDTIKHEYLVNSGPSGFDITLVAQSTFGCTDTLVQKGIIKLAGPVAQFDISNHKGCEPVNARFSNKSTGYSAFYFDYGDGSPVDTNRISSHIYHNTDTVTRQFYETTITVVSADGCEASFTSEKIEVYHYPEIGIRVRPDTVVCQRQKVEINDTGRYSNYWFYYLNGTQVASRQKDTIVINDEGVNVLKLLAQNKYGCVDTAVQNIRTRESADLEFVVPPYICEKTPFTLKLSLANSTRPFRYTWDFGEPGNADNFQTTTDSQATVSYNKPGKKIIWVTADLPNGCSIPDSIHVNVFDSDNTPVMELDYATYDSNNKVRLFYKDFTFDYLDFFNVYRDGVFLNKGIKVPELNLLDPNPDKSIKHCYSVSITDHCGVEAGKGRSHCPVILQVSSPAVRKVKLDWTYYVGWDRVDRYEIYRRQKQNVTDTFEKVGEVFSTQKSFTDSSNLCNREYEYRVAAARDGDETLSFSNTETIEPQFALYQNEMDIANVSVLLDQTVHVRWEQSSYVFNDHYRLKKYKGNTSILMEEFDVQDTFFTDLNVEPSEIAYRYTVAEVDKCGNIAGTGNYGRTILLKSWYIDNQSVLKWPLYEQWDYPVVEQHVEFVEPGMPLHIASLGGTDSGYTDHNLYKDVNGFFPYRIYAVNSNGDTSYSNISKTSGKSLYYVPNSFSPNNDGINDELRLFTLFITDSRPGDFVLTIYNRWGEQVHESTDINSLWDGTKDGALLPPGVYLYNMRMTEGGGRQIHTSGTIHLMW